MCAILGLLAFGILTFSIFAFGILGFREFCDLGIRGSEIRGFGYSSKNQLCWPQSSVPRFWQASGFSFRKTTIRYLLHYVDDVQIS